MHHITYILSKLMLPAKTAISSALAVSLTVFTSAWCCCLMPMPGAAANDAAALMVQTASSSTSTAMAISSGDHSCCTKPVERDQPFSNSTSDTPHAPSPAHPKTCACQGKLLEAPTHQTAVTPAASHASHGIFVLHLLTESWLQPVTQSWHTPPHTFAPPGHGSSTLVDLSCQLTV